MPADHGLVTMAAWVVAPSIIATQAASSFQIPVANYEFATLFSGIGIVARHCYEASMSGTFNLKKFAIDVPTAPMLGILAYVGSVYLQTEPVVVPAAVILVGFLGPEWIRSLGAGFADIVLTKIRGKP